MSSLESNIVDMRLAGFSPEGTAPDLTKKITCYCYHEEQRMRNHERVPRSLDEKGLLARFAELRKQGYERVGQDFEFIDFIEPAFKPICYLTKFTGLVSDLSKWIFGERIYDQNGTLKLTQVPHLRTWVLGRPGEPERSHDETLKYLESMIPERFSKVVELDWKEFSQLR